MMKRSILAALIATCVASVAYAGDVTGNINGIQIINDGRIIVPMIGTYNNVPSCAIAQAQSKFFIIMDETSTTAKQQLAVLLTAFSGDKLVTIVGTGTCNRSSGYEDIGYVTVLK